MSDPAAEIEFDCPLCDGAFEVEQRWLGHEVECPHCGGTVELAVESAGESESPAGPPPDEEPSVEEPAPNPFAGIATKPKKTKPKTPPTPKKPVATKEQPASPPTPAPPPTAPPQQQPRKPLSPEQRAALRRRFNLILAVSGAVILVSTFLLLSWLAQ